MQKLALFFLVTLAAQAHADLPSISGCESANTTLATAQCRAGQIEAANAKLQTYLVAARHQAQPLQLEVAAIDAEQRAWQACRDQHCGNVYTLWSSGSIGHEMSAICTLHVTQQRTADVWRAYLTYADSTPPILPDPSR